MLPLVTIVTYNNFSAFCGYDLQENVKLQCTMYNMQMKAREELAYV